VPDPTDVVSTPVLDDPDPVVTDALPGAAGRRVTRRRMRDLPWRSVVVVVLVAAVGVAWLVSRPSGPTYRTAAVQLGSAVSSISEVGTVTPVQQADLTFATAGTVGAVDVTVGQEVTAGQVLASLDPASLQTAVIDAQASLASAEATLATDEAAQSGSSSSTSSSAASGSSSKAGGTTTGGSGSGSTTDTAEIAKLQAALVADQHAQDQASAAAGAALAAATTACASSSTGSATSGGTASASTTSQTPGSGSGGSGGGSGGSGADATCTQALAAATAAHQALVTAIAQVTKDEAALSAALGLSTSGGSGVGGSGSSSGSGSGSSGQAPVAATESAYVVHLATTTAASSATGGSSSTGGSGSGSGGTSSSHTVTAEVIALDETNVDVARAALTSAQQDLGDVDLVSTLTGKVGALSVTVGQSVSAGSPSATPQVVVVGPGNDYQVATTVPVTDVADVKVGQQALVTPDSSSTAVVGTVTGIGVLGTSTSTTTTYPVTIGIQSADLGPYSGTDAGVQIVLARATGVTTVPTSAVRTVGTRRVVTVVDGGTARTVQVTVGTSGAQRTQILSGVHVGQTVSLATMAEPVPSSSTTSTRSGLAGLGGSTGLGGSGLGGATGLGGAGGFGGAGFGGGGFGGRGG